MPGLAPMILEMHDFGSPEPLSARSGSGEPVSPSVNQKCMILVLRSCHEPGLAPVYPEMHDFGSPEPLSARSGSGDPRNA